MHQEAAIKRLGWGLAIVSVALAAVSGFLAYQESGKTSDWVEVEGVVIDVDKEDGEVVGTIIRYRDPAEETYELASDYGTAESRRGDKVMLQYDPDNPMDAILSGEGSGTSSHVWFAILFGVLAVWGVVIALFDPQLEPITGRPEGLAASSLWLTFTSLIGFLTLRGSFSGMGLLILILVAIAGLVLAFSVWRMLYWSRWAAIGYSAAIIVVMIIAWARSENRFGAPLFWNLVLLAIWLMVIYALSRDGMVAAFDRQRTKTARAAA